MNDNCTHIAYGERLAAESAATRQQCNAASAANDHRWAMEATQHLARLTRAGKRNDATHAAECEGAADDN